MSFKDTMAVARMRGYTDCLVKEATEIWLHPYDFNRHTVFPLSHSWNTAANIINISEE
jgi:hypothetical protein